MKLFFVPIFEANCSWVRPAFKRSSLSRSPIIKASHSMSNKSRSTDPTVPKSSVIRSSSGVKDISSLSVVFIFLIVFSNQSTSLQCSPKLFEMVFKHNHLPYETLRHAPQSQLISKRKPNKSSDIWSRSRYRVKTEKTTKNRKTFL